MNSVAGATRAHTARAATPGSARSADANAFTVAVLSIAATLIAAYDLCILALSLH
jgi:hypothetical protein